MTATNHALLVDPDRCCRAAVRSVADRHGFSVAATHTLSEAHRLIRQQPPRIALVDECLSGADDGAFCGGLFRQRDLMLVVLSTRASIDHAVNAIRQGAHDFLPKPPEAQRLERVFAAASSGIYPPCPPPANRAAFADGLLGNSAATLEVLNLIDRAGPTEASVLVTGESGTGKELIARALHQASNRSEGPFLPVNCGAISPQLIESELFGHERGSFTGATRSRRGYFESAHGGTLFLDEVTEMPPELQAKLLRALENGCILRVGQDRPVQVDVRIVAATNRDPDEAVAAGVLRADLLYRLNVFPLHMPPLRDRRADIEPLARHFLEQLNAGSKTKKALAPEALAHLLRHDWPGNVRELRNAMHRAFILADEVITPQHLPMPGSVSAAPGTRVSIHVGTPVHEAERRLILATLDHLGGNKTAAAEMLGISLKTLYNKLNGYSGSV